MSKLIDKFGRWEKENHAFFLVMVGLVLLWFMTPILISVFYDAELGDDSAKIGDTFNWYTSLISGLATVMLVYSISLQRKDLARQSEQLELQREEMELQRRELEGTKKAMQEQVQIAGMTAQLSIVPSLLKNIECTLQDCRYVKYLSLPLSSKKDALCSLEKLRKLTSDLSEAINEYERGSDIRLRKFCHRFAEAEMEADSRSGVYVDFDGNDRLLAIQEDVDFVTEVWFRQFQGRGRELLQWAIGQVEEAVAHHDSVDIYSRRLKELSERDETK